MKFSLVLSHMLSGPAGGPVPLTHSHQVAPDSEGLDLTSSVSYMVLLEEKGEGSGSRRSHRFSADSSRSSPFSGATSHCALSWGFRVTTTLPGHRPVTGLRGLPLPSVAKPSSPACSFQSPDLLGQEVLVPRALGIQSFGDPQAGDRRLLSIFIGDWRGWGGVGVVTATSPHLFLNADGSVGAWSLAHESCVLLFTDLCPPLHPQSATALG